MQKVRWQAGRSPAAIAAPQGAIKGLIISLAVSGRRGDSAANSFHLKM
jgi:hypothetical protein